MIYYLSVYLLIYLFMSDPGCGRVKGSGLEFAPQNHVLSVAVRACSQCWEAKTG